MDPAFLQSPPNQVEKALPAAQAEANLQPSQEAS